MGSRSGRPKLRFEPLEGRSLLSGLLVALQSHVPHPGVVQTAEFVASRHRSSTNPQIPVALALTLGNQSGVYSGNGSINSPDRTTPSGPNASANFPPTALLGQGTPTQAELARERFVARFSGPMVVQPPRFSDQSKIIYLRGLGGSSPKFFLHGDYGLALVFPSGFDPKNPGGTPATSTSPGVPPVTGFAFLDDKNNNSGGIVGLDLLADPTSFDAQGRPTRLTFTSDPNVYGGIFFASQSAGVATIQYGKNTASTTFNGRIYTSGLTSPFQNVDLYAKHSG